MKKIIMIILVVMLIIVLFSLIIIYKNIKNRGRIDNVDITIGYSSDFSEEEIEDAMKIVMEKFKDFKGCTLKELWYDDKLSYGNVIILYSNFYAGSDTLKQGTRF